MELMNNIMWGRTLLMFVVLSIMPSVGLAEEDKSSLAELEHLEKQLDILDQRSLGLHYELGHGISQDYAKAGEWYLKASAQGDADAQAMLGALSVPLVVIEQHKNARSDLFPGSQYTVIGSFDSVELLEFQTAPYPTKWRYKFKVEKVVFGSYKEEFIWWGTNEPNPTKFIKGQLLYITMVPDRHGIRLGGYIKFNVDDQ